MIEIVNTIKDTFQQDSRVNSVICDSVYILNDKLIDYTAVIVDIVNCRVLEEVQEFTLRIYVLDRMANDENPYYIWDTTTKILENNLAKLEYANPTYQINYIKQDFNDLLAGCYTDIIITNDKFLDCESDY